MPFSSAHVISSRSGSMFTDGYFLGEPLSTAGPVAKGMCLSFHCLLLLLMISCIRCVLTESFMSNIHHLGELICTVPLLLLFVRHSG